MARIHEKKAENVKKIFEKLFISLKRYKQYEIDDLYGAIGVQ